MIYLLNIKKYWRNNIDGVIAAAPKDWEIIQLGVITSSFWPYAIVTKVYNVISLIKIIFLHVFVMLLIDMVHPNF